MSSQNERLVTSCVIRDTECLSKLLQFNISHNDFHDPINAMLVDYACRMMREGLFKGQDIGYLKRDCVAHIIDRACELLDLLETTASFDAHLADFVKALNNKTQSVLVASLKIAYDAGQNDIMKQHCIQLLEDKFKLDASHEETACAVAKRATPWITDAEGSIILGLQSIDEVWGGIKNYEIVTIAGRPGEGKTAVGCQIAIANAAFGKRVLFISVEMTKEEIVERIEKQLLKLEHISEADHGVAIKQLEKLPITISDNAVSINQIEDLVVRQNNIAKPDVVIVDYIQEVSCDSSMLTASVREQNQDNMLRIKKLVKRLKIPFILLAQLNRGEPDTEPTLKNIAECDKIGRDSHRVIILFRKESDFVTHNESAGRYNTVFDVVKHRSGPVLRTNLTYVGPCYTFMSAAHLDNKPSHNERSSSEVNGFKEL